jgi:tetraacyldisaccharide-1-P 4'-kinase
MKAVPATASEFAARHWYRLSPVSILLVPFSLIFRLIVAARGLLFRLGVLRSIRVRVPVIVVGNLTVGGTGKTPLLLALAEALEFSAADTEERAPLPGRSLPGTRPSGWATSR